MAEKVQAKDGECTCIIHQQSFKDGSDDHLVSPSDFKSWKTLLAAAELRQHVPLLTAAKHVASDEIPPVKYHQYCRTIFTMKRDLDKLRNNQNVEETEAETNTRSSQRQQPTNSRVYKEQCIFCESSKYVKGTKTRERLTKATELRVDEKLRRQAVLKCN